MKHRRFGILLLLVPLVACHREKIQYQTFEVTKRDLSKSVEANGSIETTNTVDVYAPVPGRLVKLFIKEGDDVKNHEKLGLMSSDARTVIVDMAAGEGKAESDYWKKQLLLTPIFSPVEGKVIVMKVYEGDKIAGPIGEISTGEIIRANLDEADLPGVKIGQNVDIHFDIDPKVKLTGKLETVGQTSKLVNNVNVYVAEVSLPSDEQQKKLPFPIKIGMSVTLYFSVYEVKGATALPLNAVNGKSLTTVNLVKVDNQTAKVKLGDSYGNWVEVQSGLTVGDKIKIPVFRTQQDKKRRSPLMIKND